MALPLNEIVSEISFKRQTNVEVKSKLLDGYSNIVYELETGKNEQWCLRVPVDAAAAHIASRGSKILKVIKEICPTLRAPAVILSSDQYTVLEFIPGYPLGLWSKSLLTKDRRQVLLDHLATFFYNLWEADLHPLKDSGWSSGFHPKDIYC